MGELKSSGKSFDISKWEVQHAWEKVKANQGCRQGGRMLARGFRERSENSCTRSGTQCPRAVIFRRRCWPSKYRSRMVRSPGSGCAHCGRSGRANSGGRAVGGEGRADLPLRFVRLPAGTVGAGCGGRVPTSVLEIRLGDPFGHPEVLRQRVMGSHRQGGGGPYRCPVGVAVCQAVAECRCGRPMGR